MNARGSGLEWHCCRRPSISLLRHGAGAALSGEATLGTLVRTGWVTGTHRMMSDTGRSQPGTRISRRQRQKSSYATVANCRDPGAPAALAGVAFPNASALSNAPDRCAAWSQPRRWCAR